MLYFGGILNIYMYSALIYLFMFKLKSKVNDIIYDQFISIFRRLGFAWSPSKVDYPSWCTIDICKLLIKFMLLSKITSRHAFSYSSRVCQLLGQYNSNKTTSVILKITLFLYFLFEEAGLGWCNKIRLS